MIVYNGLLLVRIFNNFYRLARIKAEARRKREEREHEEMLHTLENNRRAEALMEQFNEWEDKKSTQGIEPKISMAVVKKYL